jgi:hypothetical protein
VSLEGLGPKTKWIAVNRQWEKKLVRGLLQFNCCELLLWEAGSWGTGTVREPRGRGTSAVESRYQATSGEDCTRLRRPSVSYSDLRSAVINPITDVKDVYSHTQSRDNIYKIALRIRMCNFESSWIIFYLIRRKSHWNPYIWEVNVKILKMLIS